MIDILIEFLFGLFAPAGWPGRRSVRERHARFASGELVVIPGGVEVAGLRLSTDLLALERNHLRAASRRGGSGWSSIPPPTYPSSVRWPYEASGGRSWRKVPMAQYASSGGEVKIFANPADLTIMRLVLAESHGSPN